MVTALQTLLKDGGLQREGAGKRNDPFLYRVVKLGSVTSDQSEKSGSPVPTNIREPGNQRTQAVATAGEVETAGSPVPSLCQEHQESEKRTVDPWEAFLDEAEHEAS